jgi:hypothetical protein
VGDLAETITRGTATEARPPFLSSRGASFAHRAVGDAVAVVALKVMTARLGTTSTAELEVREEMLEERMELQEERREEGGGG